MEATRLQLLLLVAFPRAELLQFQAPECAIDRDHPSARRPLLARWLAMRDWQCSKLPGWHWTMIQRGHSWRSAQLQSIPQPCCRRCCSRQPQLWMIPRELGQAWEQAQAETEV